MSAFVGQATDGKTGARSVGGIRGRASRDLDPRRLSVRPCPPTFGVPAVAFKFCHGHPKGYVGNDAVWGNSLLAGDTDVLL